MSRKLPEDLSGLSMLELFRIEAETQLAELNRNLLELERSPNACQSLDGLLRAAHSLKGAARIVNLQGAVRVAHALEDCFVAAQRGKIALSTPTLDMLFRGLDLLAALARSPESELAAWEREHLPETDAYLAMLAALLSGGSAAASTSADSSSENGQSSAAAGSQVPAPVPEVRPPFRTDTVESSDRFLRLTAESLNRLLGLAGESLVESRWLRPFNDSFQRLKRHHTDLAQELARLHQALEGPHLSERVQGYFNTLFREFADAQQFLTDRMQELDAFDRRSSHLSQRLYLEVLRTRMRPFSDSLRAFPRMVRDLARSLGKQVKLEISGENTQVDREILERLETPLAHLLRNAVDHGCELPEARRQAGKPPEATLRVEAHHSAGVFLVSVSDDGAGVDPARIRTLVVQQKLTTAQVADKLADAELLEFLFLPGFTLRDQVSEISGRGFGLDAVQNMVKTVRGAIRLSNNPGRGFRVQLQLPLTLSVLRALLVEISGEPYAIPLNQISRTIRLPDKRVESLGGRQHFRIGDTFVGLLEAHQLFESGPPRPPGSELPVVVLGDRNPYGVIVDRFLGERELVVQPLDSRLGALKDISAAALMEDGSPVLIVDVDDMLRSIERMAAEGRLAHAQPRTLAPPARKPKRVLVADDSLTVRELERKLLANVGYETEVAVDGLDAWNAVQSGQYDLLITDIDMPRLGGVELAALIKRDEKLKHLPVLIVSYKDREEDRLRGLEAGADYYLTKGSFHDESLLRAVTDLIGEPAS